MTSAIACQWMEKDLLPIVERNSLLLIDSWDGYKQMLALESIKKKELKIVVLPPGRNGIYRLVEMA